MLPPLYLQLVKEYLKALSLDFYCLLFSCMHQIKLHSYADDTQSYRSPSPWGTARLYKSAKTQQQQNWAPGCWPQTLQKVGAFLLDINGVFHLPIFRSLKPWSYPSNQIWNSLQKLPFSVKHPKPLSYTSWLCGWNPYSFITSCLDYCSESGVGCLKLLTCLTSLCPELCCQSSHLHQAVAPPQLSFNISFQWGLGFITKLFSPTGHCMTCCTFALHPGTSGVLMLDCSLLLTPDLSRERVQSCAPKPSPCRYSHFIFSFVTHFITLLLGRIFCSDLICILKGFIKGT